ncbi:MAG: hypothetical protein J6Q94_07215 [Clostridia bacterium]|nr:hypothetical protein [Clostridia bacterium]
MKLIQGNYEKAIRQCQKELKSDYFEFCFSYVSANEDFREIKRFLWESKNQCTRFRNRYIGPAVIDITEWSRKYPNEYFDAFMYFIKSNMEQMQFIIISHNYCNKEITERLEEFFNIRVVDVDRRKSANNKKKNVIGFVYTQEENSYV